MGEPLRPSGLKRAQRRRTPRPSVERIRRKALLSDHSDNFKPFRLFGYFTAVLAEPPGYGGEVFDQPPSELSI